MRERVTPAPQIDGAGSPSGGGNRGIADYLRDGAHDPLPVLPLGGEALPARRRQRARLDPAAAIVGGPFDADEAFAFEAVEAGKERAGADGERALGDLLEAFCDAEFLARFELEGPKD